MALQSPAYAEHANVTFRARQVMKVVHELDGLHCVPAGMATAIKVAGTWNIAAIYTAAFIALVHLVRPHLAGRIKRHAIATLQKFTTVTAKIATEIIL